MKRITKLLALLLIMMVLFGCTAKQAQSVDSVEKEDLSANVIPSTNTAVIPELYVANKDETLEYEPVVFIKDGVTSNSTSGRPDAFESRVFGFGVRSKPEKCAYVGDTYSRDIVGAVRAGFGETFHIHSQLTAIKDLGVYEEKPTHTISDIYEVYAILKAEQE